ncbi:MAG: carboxypeptidase regulatory-like domain-containing protein [Planctomycetota bacterium]|nr:carboxypeptidase regulatory-like domain-containing protein [Planctomycetota bacterium]
MAWMDGRKVNPILVAITVLAVAFGVYGLFFADAPEIPANPSLTSDNSPKSQDPSQSSQPDEQSPAPGKPATPREGGPTNNGAPTARPQPETPVSRESPPHGDGVIEGILLDPRGQPIEGVEILAVRDADVYEAWRRGAVATAGRSPDPSTGGTPRGRFARTEAGGAFKFGGVAPDTSYWVVAVHEVLGEARSGRVVAGQHVVLQFSEVEFTSGTVTDKEGNPLTCWVATRRYRSFDRSDAVEKPGRFLVRWDGSDTLDVRLECDGYVPSDVLDDSYRGRTDVAIVLERAPRLHGIVVSPAGRPVPKAEVSVHASDDPGAEPETSASNALGRFAFNMLRPGSYKVSVASGSGTGTPVDVELNEDRELRLVLDTGPVITLRVRNAAGQPVGGVELDGRDHAGESVPYIEYPSDKAGEYFLTAFAQGGLWLEVTAPGYARQWLELQGGGSDRVLEVTLQRGASISGRVQDIADNGIPYATVRFRPHGESLEAKIVSVHTGWDGRYSVDGLAAGVWSVSILRDFQSDVALQEDITLAVGRNTRTFTLSDTSILFIELSTDGQTVASWAQVWVYAEGEDEPSQHWTSSRLKRPSIALKPGSYLVALATDRHAARPREIVVSQGENRVTFTLEAPDALRLVWIESGSDLSRAGFRTGDVVLTYDGQDVRDKSELNRLVEAAKTRESVEVVVQRGRTRVTLHTSPTINLPWTYPAKRP